MATIYTSVENADGRHVGLWPNDASREIVRPRALVTTNVICKEDRGVTSSAKFSDCTRAGCEKHQLDRRARCEGWNDRNLRKIHPAIVAPDTNTQPGTNVLNSRFTSFEA